ncbi:MAG: lysostaphin resistance A-like protein [Planctomycetota bacterium]|jgi:membrane protease YdiL (CAAX protease family)
MVNFPQAMNRSIKKATLFTLLTFFFSWLMAILFFGFGGRPYTAGWLVLTVTYMFVPAAMAVAVQKFAYKEPLKQPLGISFKLNRWFLVAWLLPVAIALVTIGVSSVFPGVEFSAQPEGSRIFEHFRTLLPAERLQEIETQTALLPVHPFWLALLQGLIAGITVNAIAGFGEELGWRGILQRELGFMGFWKSSVVIGLIWGIWHAPFVLHGHNYPDHRASGIFMMTALTLLLAPIFSYVRLKSNSVIAAAIIHGSFNGIGGLPLVVIKGGSDLTVGITGLAGFVILAIVNAAIFVYDRYFAKVPVTTGQNCI